MNEFFDFVRPTKKEKTSHELGVERIRELLRKHRLPLLPPHLIHCDSYHPDVSTRIESDKFTIFDFINSRGQFNFDIGGMFLLLAHKDVVQRCVAVVNGDVFPELVAKVKKHRSPYLERLVILSENELDEYLRECIAKVNLWQASMLE